MSAQGFFMADRGVWNDPDFANEAFSEREAFLWLVSEAAWKPRRVRVGAAVIDLERGQCAFSTRFLAAKWQWSEPRVRRFLARLIKRNLIRSKTDARATRLTICNYGFFHHTEQPSDAPPTRERRKVEVREQDNNNAALPARAREDLVRIEKSCREAASALDNPAQPLKNLQPILAWLDAGFSLEEDILPVIRAKAPKNLGSWAYFTKALQDGLDASQQAVRVAQEAARNPSKRRRFSDPITNALMEMHEGGGLEELERAWNGGAVPCTQRRHEREGGEDLYAYDAEAMAFVPSRGAA